MTAQPRRDFSSDGINHELQAHEPLIAEQAFSDRPDESDEERSSRRSDEQPSDRSDGSRQESIRSARFSIGEERSSSGQDSTAVKFTPIEPPEGYPTLDYLPTILRPQVTILVALFYAGITVGITSLAILSDAKIPYAVHSDSYYFAVRYGPGVVAAISTFVFKNTSQEILHLLPFINMAGKSSARFSGHFTVLAQYWPVLKHPNTLGTQVTMGLTMLSGILMACKTLLLEVVDGGTSWHVYVHPGVAKPLVAYYFVMLVYMVWITAWLWGRPTGIRKDWVPQSIADIINLFSYFNWNLDYPADIGLIPRIYRSLFHMSYRLGYWERSSGNEKRVVYGIRTLGNQCFGRDSKEEVKVQRRGEMKPRSPYLFYPWTSIWYFSYFVILAALLVMFSVMTGTGYLQHGAVLWGNWTIERLDHVANVTTLTGSRNITLEYSGSEFWIKPSNSSAVASDTKRVVHLLLANFVLRSVPLYLLSLVAFGMSFLDARFRSMQPYYNMSRQSVDAADSILLDFASRSPFEVTSEAFTKRYWKVFAYSLLGSAPEFLMLIPYGLLDMTSVDDIIICQFSMVSFCGTCVLIVVYLAVLLLSWPREQRALPRLGISLLDTMILCQHSYLARDPIFGICKPRWTKKKFVGALENEDYQMLMGIRTGTDGKERIGFDISRYGPEQIDTSHVQWVRPRGWRVKKSEEENSPANYQLSGVGTTEVSGGTHSHSMRSATLGMRGGHGLAQH